MNNKVIFILIFLQLVAKSFSYCQKSEYCFVKDAAIKFQQDSLRKEEANKLIVKYKSEIIGTDSLCLLGISKNELLDDLSKMIDHPNSTRLNDSGYYCGIVVVLNWLLNNYPDKYVSSVIDLTFKGETTFFNGSKKVKLPKALCKNVNYSWIKTADGRTRSDIGDVSVGDFVLGVSLVNSEKKIQKVGLLWNKATHRKANVGNFLFANTMPWEINDYFRIIGVKDIESSYYSPFENKAKILEKLSFSVRTGKMPILMENHLITSDRHKNLFYKIFGAHFIAIHDFKVNSECNTISISYWDYGSVKNYREQSEKGSPLAARSLNAAIRKAHRMEKIKREDKYVQISIKQFFKGLKGYWIPDEITE